MSALADNCVDLDIDTAQDDPLALVREDLRAFAGYSSARSSAVQASVWLNANESPWANAADPHAELRRYPDPQPPTLRASLAALYGCAPAQLLAGRGSDEAIDLLVRALCRPGGDGIVVNTPTFGMYAVNARLHGVPVIDVPLRDTPDGFLCDFDAVAERALAANAKLVFLCTPGNPTGTQLPLNAIATLAIRLRGRALVVVDEAYIELADGASAVTLLDAHVNIAVLRTLSKVHALAAARIGCVIADARLIAVLQRCQAPYPLPAPCVTLALRALGDTARAATTARIAIARTERVRMQAQLATLRGVRRVYPSQSNFVLARLDDAQAAFDALVGAGILVRDVRAMAGLGDALRISLGTPEQNQRVLDVLARVAA